MTPDLIHSVWKLIQMPGTLELSQSYPEKLVNQVVDALKYQGCLTPANESKIRDYLWSKLPLMCDLLNEAFI